MLTIGPLLVNLVALLDVSFVAKTLSSTRKIRQFTLLYIPIFLLNNRAN